jgi:hypothetical protein
MVSIRVEDNLPRAALDFLKYSYRFVNEEWQHADRDDLPDQGFESIFRSGCITRLTGWEISQEREMRLGSELSTTSGILHEIDIVAKHSDVTAIVELKNRQDPPTKNDVVVFFAKLLDYMTFNPNLLLKELCPVFMSTAAFDVHGLAVCLGLGIHPVGPGLRPVPILVDNAMRIYFELSRSFQVSQETHDKFEDFCANLNSMCLSLTDNWIGGRFGYHSEDTIVVKAASGSDSQAMSHSLRQLNSDCNWLLSSVREAMQ